MLGYEPFSRQLAICCLLLFGQRVKLAPLVRYLAIFVMSEQAQITAVRQAFCLRRQCRPTTLKQPEVVHLARTERGCQDLFGLLVSDYLSLLRVTLFLAAVASSLLFWGRSTGHSVASMT